MKANSLMKRPEDWTERLAARRISASSALSGVRSRETSLLGADAVERGDRDQAALFRPSEHPAGRGQDPVGGDWTVAVLGGAVKQRVDVAQRDAADWPVAPFGQNVARDHPLGSAHDLLRGLAYFSMTAPYRSDRVFGGLYGLALGVARISAVDSTSIAFALARASARVVNAKSPIVNATLSR